MIANHTEIISNVCPRSGCDRSRIIIGIKIIELNKYLKFKFFLSRDRIREIAIIKKGFKVSIGWNLGNKPISNHLFEPLTSTPIIGTRNKLTKASKNKIIDILISNF